MKKKVKKTSRFFDHLATTITKITGRPGAFLTAAGLVIVWGITGPFFDYSDTWQLVINTSTTIITFLMVFIIQQSQNKDTMALQLKLNEVIAANGHASNRLIDVEDLTEEELQVLKKYYVKLSRLAENEINLHQTHSMDEAENNHVQKKAKQSPKRRSFNQ
ncbi:MAG: low affinity iron permease family protein [Chitinophagales bacterium]